jgi:hypothetical protein
MSKRPTHAPSAKVRHIIQIDDWDFDYSFGVNNLKAVRGPYWETCRIEVRGLIARPKLTASIGKIRLNASEGLLERKRESTGEGRPIGYVSYRGADYTGNVFIPSDTFGLVLLAFTAKRYHWISMSGRKTGSGAVDIDDFDLLDLKPEPD